MKYPFEAKTDEVLAHPDQYVDSIFSSLASEFLIMPKGEGFLEYSAFAKGYEALKVATSGFQEFSPSIVVDAAIKCPIILLVLRSILGFTPPEWAYIASARKGIDIPQNAARSLDRNIRSSPGHSFNAGTVTHARFVALVETACELIEEGCPDVPSDKLHRLCKADSLDGLASVRQLSDLGAPYAMLLYERFLGRPFAGHRDSVSELIGDGLESAIEEQLVLAGASFRKTKRAERLPGFDQAPDFIIPDEFNTAVIIEAKLTEDDGTARDKATRIIHLCELSAERFRAGKPPYQVVACLAGRGFGVRREDMRKMITYTRGKVFTPKTLDRLVDCTNLIKFRSKNIPVLKSGK